MHPNSIEVLIKKFEHNRSYRVGKKGSLQIFVQTHGFDKKFGEIYIFSIFQSKYRFFFLQFLVNKK